MSKALVDIEVGDRVWVGDGRGRLRKLRTVTRLTPTQIILDDDPKFSRFARDKPTFYRIGSGSGYIESVATEAEVKQWEAEQAREAEEREAHRRAREAREAKRQELTTLFASERAYVHESPTNLAGEWYVEIYGSEDDMRRIAEAVRSIVGSPAPRLKTEGEAMRVMLFYAALGLLPVMVKLTARALEWIERRA